MPNCQYIHYLPDGVVGECIYMTFRTTPIAMRIYSAFAKLIVVLDDLDVFTCCST